MLPPNPWHPWLPWRPCVFSSFGKGPVTINENHPLQLKSLFIDNECIGYDGLLSNMLKNHPMERIEFLSHSEGFISEFLATLPQTGSQLKSLVLPADFHLNKESLEYIVESCVNLEVLDVGCNIHFSDPSSLDYLSNNLTTAILKLSLFDVENYDDNALCKLVKQCSKLQHLDIRGTKVTWNGVSAIIDNLHFLECLALPSKIGEELGLATNKIDMLKMEKMRKMKQLKYLLIDSVNYLDEMLYSMDKINNHNMLANEMPQLINSEDSIFEVATIDYSGHKQVEFLSPTDY